MEKLDKLPRLLITGISGYIGAWTTLYAIETGEYIVRGTVRDKNNQKRLEVLKKALGDKFDDLELVSADLNDKESLAKAVEGCDYIIHMASPYPLESPKNDDEVIKPAVDGTVGILEACVGSNVKRVVITSSVAWIMEHSKGDIEVDESSWPEGVENLTAYYRSKIYAEQAAWKFLEDLPSHQKFDIVTINPGIVIGPMLVKGDGASQKLFMNIMTGKLSSIPSIYFPIIDVRDVATAHINGLKAPPNQRYALSENTYYLPDLGEMMYEEFNEYGYKVGHDTMWKFTCWLGSLFNADAKNFIRVWDIRCHIKNDRAVKDLGMKFRDVRTSLKEMGYSLIKHGYVPDLTKGGKK